MSSLKTIGRGALTQEQIMAFAAQYCPDPGDRLALGLQQRRVSDRAALPSELPFTLHQAPIVGPVPRLSHESAGWPMLDTS